MLAQRKLPLLLDGVAGLPAAAQHDLPKAVIELGQIGLNPNRSFAASAADVSHAERVCGNSVDLGASNRF